MHNRATKLRVVKVEEAHDQRQPEDMLGFLFTREAVLRGDLADVERQIAEQRARFAAKHRLCIRPRVEQLRSQFGPAA
jgi:hypothetical protein